MAKYRIVVIALLISSCAFAKKHPGITTGIAVGAIGFLTCAPAVEKTTTCLAIGAGAGVVLGGIMGLVTTFADTEAHELPPLEEEEPPIVRVKTRTLPPPGPVPVPAPPATTPPATLDAGISQPQPPPAGDAGAAP